MAIATSRTPGTGKRSAQKPSSIARSEARRHRLKLLMNRAEKDLNVVLREPRYRQRHVVLAFLELCDNKALVEPMVARVFAIYGLALASLTKDQHLVHLALGVLIHATFSQGNLVGAFVLLWIYCGSAVDCCPRCRADWYFRWADFLAELEAGEEGLAALQACRQQLGPGPPKDRLARLAFLAAILYYKLGEHDRALDKAAQVFRDLELSSPWGYFIDNLALVAVYLKDATEERQFRKAVRILERFENRIEGLRGEEWKTIRVWLSWVGGEIYAWLDDAAKAVPRLERAWRELLEIGPARYAMAAFLDLTQYCLRRSYEPNVRSAASHFRAALKSPVSVPVRGVYRPWAKEELEQDLRRALEVISKDFHRDPEKARAELAKLRQSYTVVVPSLVAGRFASADEEEAALASGLPAELA